MKNWSRLLLTETPKKLKKSSNELTLMLTESLLGTRRSFFSSCDSSIYAYIPTRFLSIFKHILIEKKRVELKYSIFYRALQAASQNGHLEVIKVLLRYKADVEIEVSVCLPLCPLQNIFFLDFMACRSF